MMKVIIDRFEGEFAVVEAENKLMINMPKTLIPDGAKEGNVLSIIIDKEETDQRAELITRITKELFKD